ncbi:MAG: cbb3-type cytochrome c oxidase subunit 3 [Geminicoccaceae bacterium]|nr:cbb3-type cytochrome c oxidase subunit 3 [Geminicoccaceae bacterium]MDW8368949.1 cbb3-type cytochrome c oxidase subunit 3 [Geminicoccaceae bacterium]
MNDLLLFLRELWVVWLFLLFVGIVVWTWWPSRKDRLERHARIPFEDEDRPNAR